MMIGIPHRSVSCSSCVVRWSACSTIPSSAPRARPRSTARRMPLDVFETPEAVVIEAALPGIRPEEVEVSVLGDTLTLTAGSESEDRSDENGYRWREVRRGKVTRSVTLPQGVVGRPGERHLRERAAAALGPQGAARRGRSASR